MTDREKIVKELYDLRRYLEDKEWSDNRVDRRTAKVYWQTVTDAIAMLKEQDAKIGKWIPVTNSRGGMECNICHDYAPSYQSGAEYLSKYCPNCGAKMEGR